MAKKSAAPRERGKQGFASMPPELQREIAGKGGRAAHAAGTAHEFSAQEARDAGAKGGRAVARDREHMARIGKLGGQAATRSKRAAKGDLETSE